MCNPHCYIYKVPRVKSGLPVVWVSWAVLSAQLDAVIG